MTPPQQPPPLVLASGSSRRRALLDLLAVPYRVVSPDVDETPMAGESPTELVARLAGRKARAVDAPFVLAADTVVDLDGEIFGKPIDLDDARRMLARLSDRSHRVHTGVAVRRGATEVVEVVSTTVRFVRLAPADIEWYVGTGEPLDKAGAYAMQGAGGAFVAAIDGSPSNVVGLPLATVARLLNLSR